MPAKESDIAIYQQLPTDRAFMSRDKSFDKKEHAIKWIIDNSTIYVIKEESEPPTQPEPDTQTDEESKI